MEPANLLTRLLDYILEQGKEVDPRGFKLQGYEDFLKTMPDMQGLPGVDFDLRDEGDHIWLRVARLEAKPPPAFSAGALANLVNISANPSGATPSLNEPALLALASSAMEGKPAEQLAVTQAKLRAQVQAALNQYVPLWQAWAAGEAPRRRSMALYGDLFSIKQQVEAEETGKPRELVWGIGVSAWRLDHQAKSGAVRVDFQYPLITQAMEISLAEQNLALEVRPRAVDPRFEFDAFAACTVPGVADVEQAARAALAQAADQSVTPFDPGSFEHLLKLVAGNLHRSGRYQSGATGFPAPADDLLVTDAWVLLSRPRPKNYLNDDIERLKAHIAAGFAIPSGPGCLVTPPPDALTAHEPISLRGLAGVTGSAGSKGAPKELFFPLPYNQEQVTIIEQLERADGVAVQGPPGTGKTHTIANIVCHYLATGRKVLVTSKGEQALEVLQSKIPEPVRPLTVALLSGDREGLRQFQSSIEAIVHTVSHLNPGVVQGEVQAVHGQIDRAHAELAQVDRLVDEIASAQLSDVEVDGVPMRALKMAELVLSGEQQHGWFDDRLELKPEHAPPLTGDQVGELREARRRLGADLVYVTARLPSSVGLPTAETVGRLHQTLVDIHTIDEEQAGGGLPALRAVTPEVLDSARQMLERLEDALGTLHELEEAGEGWTLELRRRCRQPALQSERQAMEALAAEVQALVEARAEFLKRPVEIADAALGSRSVMEAVDRAIESGKPFGFLSFGQDIAKVQVAGIRIAGLAPAGRADWQHVRRYIGLHSQVLSFSVRWNQFAEALAIPRAEGGVAGLRAIERVCTLALKAHELATRHDPALQASAQQVFAQPPLADLAGSATDLDKVRSHLLRHLTKADLAAAATARITLQEKLAGISGPAADALKQFVEAELGAPQMSVERVVARYAQLVNEIRRIEALGSWINTITRHAELLEQAGAVRLASRVRTQPVDASGEDTALPVRWREAWNWARVRAHLDSIEAREEMKGLAQRRCTLEVSLAKMYEQVVSKSAWLSTKLGATPSVLGALATYQTSVRRIGKGTGPNATRYRRDARQAMKEAQGAIPCWVMSHAKVSETLPAVLGSFDLVIVDEASQSDLWALPAVLRGKKILVVGDDKQVSPDGGFISSTRIQELKDRFLVGQPYAPVMTPEKSLYDIASTVFAAQKVMLREHFRCVPPIIAYSNTFYGGFIQPLRIPKASERIDPPLVDVFVEGGVRSTRDENHQEALAIAEEVEALVRNPEFAGRTLGVVSLLGPDQAKYIDTLVRQRVDAMELMHRKFECGDARVFQGSERDIMFLSMVVDRNSCKALAGNMFEQRFNVAASRARDRM
jgi:hypothetical protein